MVARLAKTADSRAFFPVQKFPTWKDDGAIFHSIVFLTFFAAVPVSSFLTNNSGTHSTTADSGAFFPIHKLTDSTWKDDGAIFHSIGIFKFRTVPVFLS